MGAVQTATVERELPDTLIVTVTERAAYAIWQTGGNGAPVRFLLIDKDGNVIANQDAAAAKRREPWLLLLTGADAPQNAQTPDDGIAGAAFGPLACGGGGAGGWLALEFDPEEQDGGEIAGNGRAGGDRAVGPAAGQHALLDRPVEVIDLRLAGRLVVRPYAPPAPAAEKPAYLRGKP